MENTLRSILFGSPPAIDDGGAGVYNASVLKGANVRPAFIDVSCLIYRFIYAKAKEYAKASDVGDIPFAIAVDVVRDIADMCGRYSCAPILCFDSSVSLRKKIYVGYKSGRREGIKDEDVALCLSMRKEAAKVIRCELAPAYCIQCYIVSGYESDDIIASFVLGLKPPVGEQPYEERVVIVSSDGDLHQLVNNGVYWADVCRGVLASSEELYKHTGMKPSDVIVSKVVGGCHSDAIKGIPQCGRKTVGEILAGRNIDAVTFTKARESLSSPEAVETALLNMRLIRLPFEGMPNLRLSRKTFPVVGVPDGLRDIAALHGMNVSKLPCFTDYHLGKQITNSGVRLDVCPWKRKEKYGKQAVP